jgi:hypothetical protein
MKICVQVFVYKLLFLLDKLVGWDGWVIWQAYITFKEITKLSSTSSQFEFQLLHIFTNIHQPFKF